MPYRSPFNLPDEYMRLVGIIAAHWEALDIILQRAVADVMSLELTDVRLLTENLSAAAKFDLLAAHVSQMPNEEDRKKLNKAISSAKAAWGKRNTFVHAKWDMVTSDGEPWRISIRTKGGRLSIIQRPTELAELEDAAASIYAAGEELTQTLLAFGLLRPSP